MDDDGADPDDVSWLTATDTSLLEVLEAFRRAGWDANHQTTPDARLRCGSCGAISDAASVEVGARHRTEGASDPQDMLYVFGFACPLCDAQGAAVAGFGPASSERDQKIVAALRHSDDAIDPVADHAA